MKTLGVLHGAAQYDFLMWLLTRGRERTLRENVLDLADVKPGDWVLDVGCGTGTLAIAAKERVGPAGRVEAIDASGEMIAKARAKAAKRRLSVGFENGAAQALPYPDAQFDVVLSTIMLHHLPRIARIEALREIRRVLKPQGCLVIVEFQESGKRTPFRRNRHGHVTIDDMLAIVAQAGMQAVNSGPFAAGSLYFVRAAHR